MIKALDKIIAPQFTKFIHRREIFMIRQSGDGGIKKTWKHEHGSGWERDDASPNPLIGLWAISIMW